MHFRKRGDRNIEIGHLAQSGNQIRCVGVAIRMRLITCGIRRRIATQRYEVSNSHVPVLSRYIVNLGAIRADAGQMRGCGQGCLTRYTFHSRMCTLACRSISAVRDRNESRLQRGKSLNGFPQGLIHLFGVRRKELE